MPRAPIVLLAFALACGAETDPVAPTVVDTPAPELSPGKTSIKPPPDTPANPSASADFVTVSLEDVLSRVLPALETSGATLRGPLAVLLDDLGHGSVTSKAALLGAAERALDRAVADADEAEQADLAVIALALAAIRQDLADASQ
jgi:hypothetical protein